MAEELKMVPKHGGSRVDVGKHEVPRVSVAMAVYNTRPFLEQALDSVLSQTLTDFELIIVDDASTDGSWDVLQTYAARDGRIRLLRNDINIGPFGALNRALLDARAPYVAIMDSDDVTEQLRLERQAAYLDAHPEVGVVGCIYDAFEHDPARTRPSNARTDGSWLDGQFVMGHPTMMVRRELYALHGIYDRNYDGAGDYELQSRFAHQGVQMHVLPEVLYHYRVHPNSVSALRREEQVAATLRISMRTVIRYRRLLSLRGWSATARYLAIYLYLKLGLQRLISPSLGKRLWPAS